MVLPFVEENVLDIDLKNLLRFLRASHQALTTLNFN